MRSIRIPCPALYRQLSPLLPRPVGRQGVDHSRAPHRSVAVAFIRLVTQND
jgi:hypothetical protein